MTTNRTQRELNMLFLWGFLLGTLCFLAVYGLSTLDVTHSGWIFGRDIDVRQHYIGWISFRNSDWSFPLGMIYNLSYPVASSIVYTDSIPLLAIFFKLIRNCLPETFQYFGWFTLLSYALMGGFFSRLSGRLVKNNIVCMIYPAVAVLSFTMLEKSFYHTSLTAQWIIIWAIDLWISKIYERGLIRQVAQWSFFGIICAGIHLYFLPMVLGIMCVCYLEEFLSKKYRKAVCELLISFFCTCAVALFCLYIFGAFSGASTGEYWVGDFNSNLNCFFNSLGKSFFLPDMGEVSSFQHEGTAYLGLGVMMLYAVCLITLAIRRQLSKFILSLGNMPRLAAAMVMCIVFGALAVCPVISFGSRIIFTIPYPRFLMRILGIFRSNGRFIWPVMYAIFAFAPVMMEYTIEHITLGKADESADCKGKRIWPITALTVILVVFIQLLDLSPRIASRYEFAHKEYKEKTTEWDMEGFDTKKYRHMVSFIDDVEFLMKAAYYGSRNGVTTNNFYYARNVDEHIQAALEMYGRELDEKKPREDVIYIFGRVAYEKYKDSGLHIYGCEGCVYGTKDPIEGKKEFSQDEADSMEWE